MQGYPTQDATAWKQKKEKDYKRFMEGKTMIR